MQLSATQDLAASLRTHWRLWLNLGIRDTRGRYRRTVLGPFWTVLSNAVMIVSLGLVYSILWKLPVRELLPYFCAGYITWTMLTTVVSESAVAFIGADPIIKSLSLPYLVHILRVIWRNLILFAHSLVVYAAVMIYFRLWPGASLLLLPPALLLLSLNFLWISLVVAVVCTRFRDVIQVVASVLQVLFFVTPIFWPVERLEGIRMATFVLADANFAYHLVDVVRGPLIGEAPHALTWIFLIVSAILGNVFALAFFERHRRHLAFWL
ncbi:MAG: ABC transporter permease [Vicinamibacterales bacterium]